MTLHAMGDWQLLQAYAKNRSETAFAELVRRHLDWVFSVALRHVGDPPLAEDVVQSVFVLLARKARDLRPGTLLSGWLFRTTRHVAAHARRAEQRRKIREATACAMNDDTTSPDTTEVLWQQLVPHLDQAVAALSEADRMAILLRFYEKMPVREVGERLGVSNEAAKKRVSRSLEKMRTFLERRGVRLSGVVLAAILADKTVQTASATLAGVVVKISMATASISASAALPPLVRETLRAWQLAKIKLAAGFGAGSLALIFVAVIASGLLTHHASSPSVSTNNSPRAEDTAMATGQLADAFSAPAVSGKTQTPPKTGAITGLVVNEKGHPIRNAKVWGGLSSQPFAQDSTDQSGQFALDKIASPPFVTVAAEDMPPISRSLIRPMWPDRWCFA